MNKNDVIKMKPSAYKSMLLKKFKLNKEQPTKKQTKALVRWKDEKWVNLTSKITDKKVLACGQKGKRQKELDWPTVCRPSIKITKDTPIIAISFTDAQIKKAIKIKREGKRIIWKDL